MLSPEMWSGWLDSLQHRTGVFAQHVLLNHKSMPRAGIDYVWTVQGEVHHLDIRDFQACFGDLSNFHAPIDHIKYLESMCLYILYIITQRIKSGRMTLVNIARLTVGCSDPRASDNLINDLHRITNIIYQPQPHNTVDQTQVNAMIPHTNIAPPPAHFAGDLYTSASHIPPGPDGPVGHR